MPAKLVGPEEIAVNWGARTTTILGERRLILWVIVAMAACTSPSRTHGTTRVSVFDAAPDDARQAAAVDAQVVADCAAAARELAPGLTVERVAAGDGGPAGTCVTLVRVDPARYALRVLSASHDGQARGADAWAKDFAQTGVINSSMYMDDGHSTGRLRDAHATDRAADNPQMGAFLLFDPIDAKDPPLGLVGRGCPGVDVDALQQRYRGVVQNYRLMDCDGKPVPWKGDKHFSAAAVAVDSAGRLVLVHTRAPWQMRSFARRIAAPELGLAAAMYVEGGPEASLYVHAGEEEIREVGSWQDGFWDASNTAYWPIPNVLAFAPRSPG
jgi:hypothetical protein